MKLMVLDGNSIVNRAFYGIRLLSNREGLYTNAIYGFLNIMYRMEQEEKPDALCVTFDLHGPTFRHLKFAEYKATRHGMPEELAVQMPVLKQVLAAMNIPIYECQGWEADDVIGTISKKCSSAGCKCIIATGDRDSLQLIDDNVNVRLITTKGGENLTTKYDAELFEQEYGFAPAHLVDLKSLMGDSSDNIPGVAGVGQKTATSLLAQFGSLQGIYDALDDPAIKESVRKKLIAGKEMAFLSYDLAKIRCDAPIVFQMKDTLRRPVNAKQLRELFVKLDFHKLMNRYGLQDAAQTSGIECAFQTLPEFPSHGKLFAIAVDETMTQFAVATADGVFSGEMAKNAEPFLALLEGDAPKACCDLKQVYKQCADLSLNQNSFIFDAALAGYVLNPSESEYSLDRLCLAFLNLTLPDHALCTQAWAILQLQQELMPRIEAQGMGTLYREIELPLCFVLAQMEQLGVGVDEYALVAFQKMLADQIARCETEIFTYAGEEFNINSTKKLGEILFDKLNLPVVKKTKTGYSTNVEVLEKLRSKHPIVQQIMDYRMLTKLKSTYADGLLKVISSDGRIHTTFQNMVTATGRLSSTDPNLQNIPVRTELGSEIRKMFVAREGWSLVDADYSQIELRVLSHIANDQTMQEAFRSGEDIHAVTASQVFGVPLQDVTPLMRRHAKAVNFGIVYGISEFSLAEDIGVTRWEAKDYIERYLEKYSGVRAYMKDIVQEAKRTGFVTTLFGRRRYLPELKSSNYNIRASGERIALNTPIQGTAADIIKLAMIRVAKALEAEQLQGRLVLQIHDELIVECPDAEIPQIQEIMTREMEQAVQLTIPLTVEAKSGKTWYEAK